MGGCKLIFQLITWTCLIFPSKSTSGIGKHDAKPFKLNICLNSKNPVLQKDSAATDVGRYINIPAESMINGQPTKFRLKNEIDPPQRCETSDLIPIIILPQPHVETRIENDTFVNELVYENDFGSESGLKVTAGDGIDQKEPNETTITKLPLFSPDGYIFYEGESFDPSEYCITPSHENPTTLHSVKLCRPDCESDSIICLRKCCPPGQGIDMKMSGCAFTGEKSWIPRLYEDAQKLEPMSDHNLPQRHFNVQLPETCNAVSSDAGSEADLISRHNRDHKRVVDGVLLKSQSFRVLTTGVVVIRNEVTDEWIELPSESTFCLDSMQNFGEGKFYSGDEEDEILVMCASPVENVDHANEILRSITLFISSGFLLLTLIVQATIFDKKTAHGWTLLFSLLSMFFTYMFLGTSHLIPMLFEGTSTKYLKSVPCIVVGVLAHYFALSTFAWMTIFDYEIWHTFRSIEGLSQKFVSGKRLYTYVFCGFGVSLIIVSTGLSLDYVYKDIDAFKSKLILPKYGQETCYISQDALGLYLYSVIGFFMTCNVFFICSTAANIHSVRSESRGLQRTSKQQSSLQLFGKLFFIMGVTWILEFISWAHSQAYPKQSKEWYWTLSDMFIILQPIGIFVIVVCKRKTMRKLQSKLISVKSMVTSFPSFSRTSVFSTKSSSKHYVNSSRKGSNVTSMLVLNDKIKSSAKFKNGPNIV